VVCRVAGERFALPITAIQEVVATPVLTRVPGAPEAVRGIANVRGTLVTVVSGPALFGIRVERSTDWLLVLSMLDGTVGLEVDEVEDLHAASTASRLPTLDVEALVRPLFRSEAAKA
jgi:purine-binding chemotaxis protein CheW